MALRSAKPSLKTETRVKPFQKLLVRGTLIGGISLSMLLLLIFGDDFASQFRKKEINSSIEWANIDVQRVNDETIYLNWATIKEEYSRQFSIEKSLDREHIETIAVILAAEHSSEVTTYQYYDLDVEKNRIYYYRFKYTDVLGNEKYTAWIETRPNLE